MPKRLSKREKEYIRQNIKTKFKRQIAHELAELFPEDNNGIRNVRTIRKFVQEEKLE